MLRTTRREHPRRAIGLLRASAEELAAVHVERAIEARAAFLEKEAARRAEQLWRQRCTR